MAIHAPLAVSIPSTSVSGHTSPWTHWGGQSEHGLGRRAHWLAPSAWRVSGCCLWVPYHCGAAEAAVGRAHGMRTSADLGCDDYLWFNQITSTDIEKSICKRLFYTFRNQSSYFVIMLLANQMLSISYWLLPQLMVAWSVSPIYIGWFSSSTSCHSRKWAHRHLCAFIGRTLCDHSRSIRQPIIQWHWLWIVL